MRKGTAHSQSGEGTPIPQRILLPLPGRTTTVDEGHRVQEQPESGLAAPHPRTSQSVVQPPEVISANLVQAGRRPIVNVHATIISSSSKPLHCGGRCVERFPRTAAVPVSWLSDC